MEADDDSSLILFLMIFGGLFVIVAVGIVFVILQYRKINSTPSNVSQMSNGGSTYGISGSGYNSDGSSNSGSALFPLPTVSDAPLNPLTVILPAVVTQSAPVYTPPPVPQVDKQKPIKDVLNRRVQIMNFNKPGLCLDNDGGGNNTQMHYWSCDRENQEFVFEPIIGGTSDGPYRLREITKTTCMDDDGGFDRLNSYDCRSTITHDNQKFRVGETDVDGFGSITIESASKPGYCVNDGGGDKGSGWRLQPCNKNDRNQQFFLKPF